MFGGVVSAASIWGNFKGNPIIQVSVDGKVFKPTGNPAITYNKQTMIPLSVLDKAGIKYKADSKKQTLNIETALTPAKATSNIIDLGGSGVTIVQENKTLNSITYFNQITNYEDDWFSIYVIFNILLNMNTPKMTVEYFDKTGITHLATIEVSADKLNSYVNGKISETDFNKSVIVTGDPNRTSSTTGSNEQSTVTTLELYSNDGKVFLGILSSNTYDDDSVFNTYGDYGSQYNLDSIWNEYGDYGSQYSSTSAFNKYATKPPIIVQNGKIVGYLTVNTTFSNAISPVGLLNWLIKNGY